MADASRQDSEGSQASIGTDGPSPAAADIAAYLASVLPQLKSMADRADLDLIAYLLDVARLELEEQLQRSQAG